MLMRNLQLSISIKNEEKSTQYGTRKILKINRQMNKHTNEQTSINMGRSCPNKLRNKT